ncbi:MAG TPA: hypothetical protein VER33_05820 [Polyangiaceae bacterium]|nr:hypothetical protein [Polyangiaceae bacterium]
MFFLNSWTYSALHQSRREHAAAYLRENADHLPEAARPHLESAAFCYDAAAERLGAWDASDPTFGYVKQKKLDTWTAEVRRKEIAVLTELHDIEVRAMSHLESALRAHR